MSCTHGDAWMHAPGWLTSSSMRPLAGPWPPRGDSRRRGLSPPWGESLGFPPLGVPLAEPCSLLSSTGTSSTPLPCEVVLRSPNRRGGGMPHLQSMRNA